LGSDFREFERKIRLRISVKTGTQSYSTIPPVALRFYNVYQVRRRFYEHSLRAREFPPGSFARHASLHARRYRHGDALSAGSGRLDVRNASGTRFYESSLTIDNSERERRRERRETRREGEREREREREKERGRELELPAR